MTVHMILGVAILCGLLVAIGGIPLRQKLSGLLALFTVVAGTTLLMGWDKDQSLFTGTMVAEGRYEDGTAVETVLEIKASAGPRSVRALALTRSVPWLQQSLGALFVVALLGFLTSFRSRWHGPLSKRERLDFAVLLALALACIWLSTAIPSSEVTRETIRSFLGSFSTAEQIQSFTLPRDQWRYVLAPLNPAAALGYLVLLSVIALIFRDGVLSLAKTLVALEVCALLLVSMSIWLAIQTGGFPWREPYSSAVISTLLVVFAVNFGERPRLNATLGLSAAVPLLFAAMV